jgi:hypothetical protein
MDPNYEKTFIIAQTTYFNFTIHLWFFALAVIGNNSLFEAKRHHQHVAFGAHIGSSLAESSNDLKMKLLNIPVSQETAAEHRQKQTNEKIGRMLQ